MPLSISAGVATDTGRVRTVNEDAWCLQPRLYAVADGMGGHAAGDRASRMAVDALAELGTLDDLDVSGVQQALEKANRAMLAEPAPPGTVRTMGTTVAGIAVIEVDDVPQWAVFNVGDSRVYAFERGRLTQITTDHSEVQELVDAGRLSPDDARDHPRRNVVTRSLGGPSPVAVDVWLLPVVPGQTFLICSDGLNGELTDHQIASVLARPGTTTELARQLVAEAVAAGGSDNVTALVLRLEDQRAEDQEDREDTIPRLDVTPVRDDFLKGRP